MAVDKKILQEGRGIARQLEKSTYQIELEPLVNPKWEEEEISSEEEEGKYCVLFISDTTCVLVQTGSHSSLFCSVCLFYSTLYSIHVILLQLTLLLLLLPTNTITRSCKNGQTTT